MSDEVQKMLIQSLSRAVTEKSERFHALGMTNVATDPADRARQRIEYEQAQAELIRAECALESILRRERHE